MRLLKGSIISVIGALFLLAGCQSTPQQVQPAKPAAQKMAVSKPIVAATVAPAPAKAAQPIAGRAILHALFVIDTNDPQIGTSTAVDLADLRAEVEKAATIARLNLSYQEITGNDFRPYNVERAIKEMKVGPNDVIMFYYSGHGLRFPGQISIWPQFDMPVPLPFDRVQGWLQAKKPRFLLAMADACNTVVEEDDGGMGTSFRSIDAANGYNDLFNRFQGEIFVTSSLPGQFSYTTPGGSWFTQDFLTSLRKEARTKNASWDDVFAAINRTRSESYNGEKYEQTPHIKSKARRL
jgi:hypothetical protein